eukprot:2205368-Prymnesium_polylepis.2
MGGSIRGKQEGWEGTLGWEEGWEEGWEGSFEASSCARFLIGGSHGRSSADLQVVMGAGMGD